MLGVTKEFEDGRFFMDELQGYDTKTMIVV